MAELSQSTSSDLSGLPVAPDDIHAAAETIRRSLDAILAAPRASVAGAATSSSVPLERGGPASVKVANTGVGKRPDDDPTALRKVASAG